MNTKPDFPAILDAAFGQGIADEQCNRFDQEERIRALKGVAANIIRRLNRVGLRAVECETRPGSYRVLRENISVAWFAVTDEITGIPAITVSEAKGVLGYDGAMRAIGRKLDRFNLGSDKTSRQS
jgi:hypothetical protein